MVVVICEVVVVGSVAVVVVIRGVVVSSVVVDVGRVDVSVEMGEIVVVVVDCCEG